jgi:hypothetical protein
MHALLQDCFFALFVVLRAHETLISSFAVLPSGCAVCYVLCAPDMHSSAQSENVRRFSGRGTYRTENSIQPLS